MPRESPFAVVLSEDECIEPGSSRGIPCSWKRPAPSSISTKVSGKDILLAPRILCSPPTRKPAFKRVTEGIFPFRPPRKARSPS